MIKWIKWLFSREPEEDPLIEPITNRAQPLRYLGRLLQNYAMLESAKLTAEEKRRYRLDIRQRKVRLIKAGYAAPDNMEEARQMLGRLADQYEQVIDGD